MTLTIELSDRLAEPLKAEALAQGVSPDRYVSGVVEQALSTSGRAGALPKQPRRPIWDAIADSMKDVPPEDMAALPIDGASQIDHYVYGLPKRDR